ncbi:GntR family transcriptional regulator [Pseudomonas sp. SWRI74]|uniref:GntR family transcriptional regulator n=1 Tax=Pseudomonas azerbaijanoccidentalis TaxID=2842347 RepID=A0ABS6QYN2_9PSED|nr:GntR family transcriptional regulator [Pseudomonas azerbaijanoccidentalis]MBV4523581.1 GntR family transcriptional regulator [Pseudomonas azerbaijanoccidentalis]
MNSLALVQYSRETPAALPFCRARHDKSLVDDLYPRVFDAILEQRISASSRFTEESLGQMFSASRSHVRRVLTRLSHEQIVILRPNHRPQIAAPAPEQTRQILHARRLTETTLIQLACQQPRPAAVKALRALIDNYRQKQARGQHGAAIRLSGEFHLQLADMAGNAPLAHFLGSLVPMTSLAIAQCEQQTAYDHIEHAHAAIVEAVERADVNAAVRLVTQHLADLEQRLLGSTA